MKTTVTIDKAGRVAIPKALRAELNLVPGDTISLESEGDQVTLRPVRAASRIRQDPGMRASRKTGKKKSVESVKKVLRDIHAEREHHFLTGDFE
jgi:AbrB family looped-hinge helix DNA binding protein